MHFLDATWTSIEANLAVDEALLEQAERGEQASEILRTWEPQVTAIILGRSSRVQDEVNATLAEDDRVPILRRASGGASVVVAPGCLAYSLLLSYQSRPELRMIDVLHRFVTEKMVAALLPLESRIRAAGTCDLVLDDCKVSGNSVRCRRDWLLYHGTLLIDMDLSVIDRYLQHPPREPDYRKRRPHGQFTANLNLPREGIVANLKQAWTCSGRPATVPDKLIATLMQEKYCNRAWNFQR